MTTDRTTPPEGRLQRHGTLLRALTVAAIVLVVGGLFVQREFLAMATDLGPLESHRPAVGEPAPDFRVALLDGETATLSDYRGKTVILNFWATWCTPCRVEMPEFQEAYEHRLPDGDFVVLAVDVAEGPTVVGEFVDAFGLTFPIGLDRTGEVSTHYGVRGLPATFFIDRDGIIRRQMYGPVYGDLLPEGIRLADEAGAAP
jgi:peroxiredoxin